MRVQLEQAYILHRRPYSNTSLLLEFFTKNYGRISAIARSARGLHSRYRGKLEPFTMLLISFSGKNELKYLGSVEWCGAPNFFADNGLLCGFYLNEILMRLMAREDPHSILFDHYHATIERLKKSSQIECVLRLFEKILLQELGFGLTLISEYATNEPIVAQNFYKYVPDCGFIRATDDESAYVFRGASLLALHHSDLSNSSYLKDAKRLLRLAISSHLGAKPLKSRELFL